MANKKISGAADLFPAGGSARYLHKIKKLLCDDELFLGIFAVLFSIDIIAYKLSVL